jgi:hypothetical protein
MISVFLQYKLILNIVLADLHGTTVLCARVSIRQPFENLTIRETFVHVRDELSTRTTVQLSKWPPTRAHLISN